MFQTREGRWRLKYWIESDAVLFWHQGPLQVGHREDHRLQRSPINIQQGVNHEQFV